MMQYENQFIKGTYNYKNMKNTSSPKIKNKVKNERKKCSFDYLDNQLESE